MIPTFSFSEGPSFVPHRIENHFSSYSLVLLHSWPTFHRIESYVALYKPRDKDEEKKTTNECEEKELFSVTERETFGIFVKRTTAEAMARLRPKKSRCNRRRQGEMMKKGK